MKKFSVRAGEAEELSRKIFKAEDSEWKTLVERSEHDISENYNLRVQHNRLSLYRTLRALKGRDYKAALGADTTLNNVRVTEWSPDTCGCKVAYLSRRDLVGDWTLKNNYDIGHIVVHEGKSWTAIESIHYEDWGDESPAKVPEPGKSDLWEKYSDEAVYVKHVAHHSIATCPDHAACEPHSADHLDQVTECCQHKNHCVHEAAEALGVDPKEVRFRYQRRNGQRILVLQHGEAMDTHKRAQAELRINNHDKACKRPFRVTF